jgi:hypothetical protein
MEENNQTSTPKDEGASTNTNQPVENVEGSGTNTDQSTGDSQKAPEVKTDAPSEASNNSEDTPSYPIEGDDDNKTSGAMKTRAIFRTIVLIVIVVAVIWFFNSDGQNDDGEILGEEENGTTQEQPTNTAPGDSNQNDGSADIVIEDNSDLVEITAYYAKVSGGECNEVVALKRNIEKKYDQDIVNTVRGLLTPLTEAEKAQGLTSSIPVGTYLTNVFVDGDGQALVKLNRGLNDVGDSCVVTSAQAQMEQTLLQFSYVNSVVIE